MAKPKEAAIKYAKWLFYKWPCRKEMSRTFHFKSSLKERNIKWDRNKYERMKMHKFLSRDTVKAISWARSRFLKTDWQNFQASGKTNQGEEKRGQWEIGREMRERGRQGRWSRAFVGNERRLPPVNMVHIKTMKGRSSSLHSCVLFFSGYV